jgi:HAD domain in Swiss Army Knife RNA repair proteins
VKKTIFLDFDGVLHPTSAGAHAYFCQANLLAEVVKTYKPNVVVSSSWRFHFSIIEILQRLPEEISNAIVGFTGDAYIGRHARWNEIQKYCVQHKVVAWVALDDSTFEFPSPCEQLIACNPNIGLSAGQIEVLSDWLGQSNTS